MKLASVDTSTFTESVALVDGDALIGERNIRRAYGHASGLHADLNALLVEAEWSLSDLDGLVIGIGPGSFTGLRVGMAAVKGLAYALDLPLYGVSSAVALLRGLADERDALALIDARRGEIYAHSGLISGFSASDHEGVTPPLLDQPLCGSPEDLIDALATQGRSPRVMVGEGALKYRARFIEAWPEVYIPTSGAAHIPRASLLASGLTVAIERGEIAPASTAGLEPIYVRASDAEINYPDGFPSEARLFS